MSKLSGVVGQNGVNNVSDVRLIQHLLNEQHIPGVTIPLLVDGKIGNQTIERIKIFQKTILSMLEPDGRVDPNGRTFSALAAGRPGTHPAGSFSLSDKGLNLLASIEQLATKPYDDQNSNDIDAWVQGATIGYGHLITQSEWNEYKNGITQEQAISLFRRDLKTYIQVVQEEVTVDITQYEFDALVIFTFNIGKNAFKGSSVLKLINDPDASTPYENLEQAWMAWDKSQGKINKGLQNRRRCEWNIFSNNRYEKW